MKHYNDAILSYYDWLKKETTSVDLALHIISMYETVLSGMSKYLIESTAKFDVFLIIVSIVLSLQVCVIYFFKIFVFLMFNNFFYFL